MLHYFKLKNNSLLRPTQCLHCTVPVLLLRCDGGGETSTRLPLELSEGLVSCSCLWSLLEVLEVIIIGFGPLSQQHVSEQDANYDQLKKNVELKAQHCYLCRRETGNKVSVCGCLSRCCRCHSHDRWCWCGHSHGDRGLGHHGLLVLGHNGGHGHSQGRQVGHWWRRELTEDFHIHCWKATLKQRKLV